MVSSMTMGSRIGERPSSNTPVRERLSRMCVSVDRTFVSVCVQKLSYLMLFARVCASRIWTCNGIRDQRQHVR